MRNFLEPKRNILAVVFSEPAFVLKIIIQQSLYKMYVSVLG